MKKAIQSISFRDTVYVSTFCLLLSAFPANAKEVNSYNSEVLPVTNITQQNKTVTGTVVDKVPFYKSPTSAIKRWM